ncbi:DNA methyltransferase [Kineococcus sp. SYSU DK004]|uniref:DNA methyltransferase n=1 Tax=Kineococcus sp. SYSU DK004 TaxID=3383125 RepID=UPI003D7C3B14
MATSDAILIGEDWISEHYVNTDSKSQSFQAKVLERRKVWDETGEVSTRARFVEQRGWLLDRLSVLSTGDDADVLTDADADLPEVYACLRQVLGYDGIGLHTTRTGPVLHVSAPGMAEGAPLVIVEGRATTTVDALLAKDLDTLLTPYPVDEKTELRSVARTVSALFVADHAPDYALVFAGRHLLLAERARWAEGRYLAVDLQLVCERNDAKRGGEVDRALTCVSAESVAPDAEGDVWWTGVLEESIKHTVGVSKDLREGVRLSIEILANEVVSRRAQQGLDPLPADQAQPLAKQSLRFLYRILFLLYAEASPELGVLPAGAPEYEQGYSLDRLRELTLVELASPAAKDGTHLYDSLAVLFRLVDRGHDPGAVDAEGVVREGLTFRGLRADLFKPEATAHIDAVKLGNDALQRVLRHLLLSKEQRGRDRGFISYAELGINQLGAVYEGLMSYTGSFAETDLYEVAKGGDASKGSWVVRVDRADGISPADFVRVEDPVTGEETPVLHERGTFVFRLSGRDRQQSASFYTPEVLTRFVVSQALEELLDQDGTTTPAADILQLTVCEPALGSGAFAIEAVRQLAEQYLRRRQEELGERIDPDEYPRELQRVKASIALHQVYGVDLNATAVELAEISLWLDTMVAGLEAPWFGLHLRRGNSLIGARRTVFRRDQVAKGESLTAIPTDVPLTSLAQDVADGKLATGVGGGVHHFLVPASGWGSAVEAKEAKALAPEALDRLKKWRRAVQAKPTKAQADALVDLSYRVEALWQIALRRLQIAEQEIRRAIPLWGMPAPTSGGAVQREQIEAALADASGAYQRLRRVMDAWCALWFWPLTDTLTTRVVEGCEERIDPPTLAQWIDALQGLLGRHEGSKRKATAGHDTLVTGATWDELGDQESIDLGFASARTVDAVLRDHPWLRVCEAVAKQQGLFHWELDFAQVFARGGFDLQVGNPPWVRPEWDESATLGEIHAGWMLNAQVDGRARAALKSGLLSTKTSLTAYVDELARITSTRAVISEPAAYPYLSGLRPDLYRCFMSRTWRHRSSKGAVGLIHPETHFTDEKAGLLREATYKRLRQHWQFLNELYLFDIDNHVSYGVHVYGSELDRVKFSMASSLYHPDVVPRSVHHDGSGAEPGLRNDQGEWELRPHNGRIFSVTDEVLTTWRDLLEDPTVPALRTRMVYVVNRAASAVLSTLSALPRLNSLGPSYSQGWNETTDFKRGVFHVEWGAPVGWEAAILQGPHIFVNTPMYKHPNSSMKSNRDWSLVDFERMDESALPITSYKPVWKPAEYGGAYSSWSTPEGVRSPREYFRISWRGMASNTGERTLIPALTPPGAAHVDGVFSASFVDRPLPQLITTLGYLSTLLADFLVRIAPKSTIRAGTANRLPVLVDHPLNSLLTLRVLRMNCVTDAYSEAWRACFDAVFSRDEWANTSRAGRVRAALNAVPVNWDSLVPLRIAEDRRQAQVEIDALVGVMAGVDVEDLCTLYRTQFPVLRDYDQNVYLYDMNGRLVPNSVLTVWRKKGDSITEAERTATNQAGNTYTYELPFVTLDREADMRQAYAVFEQRLKERS